MARLLSPLGNVGAHVLLFARHQESVVVSMDFSGVERLAKCETLHMDRTETLFENLKESAIFRLPPPEILPYFNQLTRKSRGKARFLSFQNQV